MADETGTLAEIYHGWELYQEHLIAALRPLADADLLLSAPRLRSIGQIAAHIVGARARWLHRALGEGGPELAALMRIDAPESGPTSATRLVEGLTATWQVLRDGLSRWSADEMAEILQREYRGEQTTLTRQWVIWHLIEHDLHHGGELSFSLGMHELKGLEI